MSEVEDTDGDKLTAIVAGIARLFYMPLVLSDGWRWHVASFWDVQTIAYWHMFGLVVLYGSLSGSRKLYAPSTVTDGQIAVTTLTGLALSHWIMWLVL